MWSVAPRHKRNAVLQAELDQEGVIMESYYGSHLSPCHYLFQIESTIWVPVGLDLTVMHPLFEWSCLPADTDVCIIVHMRCFLSLCRFRIDHFPHEDVY